MTFGWCTAPQGYQPCLPLAIQKGTPGGMGLFLPVEGGLQPLFDQSLSDAQHGMDTDGEALGYPCICPGMAIRIGFQKDMGMAYLVGRRGPLPGQLSQLSAFLIRKTYDVLLVHGTLHLITHYALRWNNNLLTSKNKADKVLGCSAQAYAHCPFAALHALFNSLPCHLTEKIIHRLHISTTAHHRHLVVVRSGHRIEAFRLVGVGE